MKGVVRLPSRGARPSYRGNGMTKLDIPARVFRRSGKIERKREKENEGGREKGRERPLGTYIC